MANYELKFIDLYGDSIQVNCTDTERDGFVIEIQTGLERIWLDKSTAIKFAKTLRTEINKIPESEVKNG